MKTILKALLATCACFGIYAFGYITGNHCASTQALNELQMISNSAYEATTDPIAKSVFASHMCSVLKRKISNFEKPFEIFREHKGSFAPDTRTKAEHLADTKLYLEEWTNKSATATYDYETLRERILEKQQSGKEQRDASVSNLIKTAK
jgi:hypothetical protein